jgi:hypothetical protein
MLKPKFTMISLAVGFIAAISSLRSPLAQTIINNFDIIIMAVVVGMMTILVAKFMKWFIGVLALGSGLVSGGVTTGAAGGLISGNAGGLLGAGIAGGLTVGVVCALLGAFIGYWFGAYLGYGLGLKISALIFDMRDQIFL